MPIPVSPSDFRFETDEQSVAYLRQVVEAMMKLFGIAREEAIGRINQEWSHVRAVVAVFSIWGSAWLVGLWPQSAALRPRHCTSRLSRR
jgi:hypothetical protein